MLPLNQPTTDPSDYRQQVQREYEALAERVMLALLNHDGAWNSPGYLADEAFRIARAYIAKCDQERGK